MRIVGETRVNIIDLFLNLGAYQVVPFAERSVALVLNRIIRAKFPNAHIKAPDEGRVNRFVLVVDGRDYSTRCDSRAGLREMWPAGFFDYIYGLDGDDLELTEDDY